MKFTQEELYLVSSLCHTQARMELEYAAAEEALKAMKKDLDHLRQVELPNAMAELGVASIVLDSGEKIEVKEKYYAAIPAENKAEAFQWLADNKLDGVIKNVVTCSFNKGENELATTAMKELTSLGFHPEQEMSVHHMTLKSLIKDLFQRGVEFPIELFGAGVVNESKVTVK